MDSAAAGMQALQVDDREHRLRLVRIERPVPQEGELLVRVRACGVCRTDLHVLDAELPPLVRSVVPGHEIVGDVVALGPGCHRFAPGDRVGIPWLAWTCGECDACRAGRENLCPRARFTGYSRDGGYAQYTVAAEAYCLRLPAWLDDLHAAPLLCAGLIGYRAWNAAGGAAARRLGLLGFGASAHLVCQLAVAQGQQVHAFTRPGDAAAQAFARELGAAWAGGSDDRPPGPLDASILFAPDGALVPAALALARPGGRVVCAGIHMSRIPAFDYALLWGERQLRSVANLTRADGEEYMALLARHPVRPRVQAFDFRRGQEALDALRRGAVEGAAVLVMPPA